ncbi:MAG: DUF3592 domain-containing protein [Candidatus Omnitrophota bacterium]|nr:DUF3592 domain-containing protein [Candidatus Omnitrophota bacterium]
MQRGSFLIILVAILLSGLGVALVSVSQQSAVKDQAVQTWHETLSTITRAEAPSAPADALPIIEFEYEAKGEKHQANQLLWGTGIFRDAYQKADGIDVVVADVKGNLTTRTFSAGQKLPVQYNPTNPSEAVLIVYTGSAKRQVRLFVIGVICVLGGLLAVGRTIS